MVSMRDRRMLRREADGTWCPRRTRGSPRRHPNDMVVDAQGRAYVGNFGFDLMGGAHLAPSFCCAPIRTAASPGSRGPVVRERQRHHRRRRPARRRDLRQPDQRLRPKPDGSWRTGGPGRPSAPAHRAGAPRRAAGPRRGPGRVQARRRRGLVGRGRAERPGHPGARGRRDHGADRRGHGRVRLHSRRVDGRTLFICAAPDFDEQARSAAREGQLLVHPGRRPARRHGPDPAPCSTPGGSEAWRGRPATTIMRLWSAVSGRPSSPSRPPR